MVIKGKSDTTEGEQHKKRDRFVIKKVEINGINYLETYINGNFERRYKQDWRIKHLKNINYTNASREAIVNYYENKQPNPNARKTIQLKSITQINDSETLKLDKRISNRYQTFKNTGELFSSRSRLSNKYWNYMYIEVVVSIHFDFKQMIEKGKGNNYYELIPDYEITSEIYRGIMRAISKYGSNVNFRLLRWYYVYRKRPIGVSSNEEDLVRAKSLK
jgi:hypothetical protein